MTYDGAFMTRLFVVLSFMLTVSTVEAQEWPQFRGPDGEGHSSERGLPLDWSETRNVAWKTPEP